jgi:uncharacterized protein
MNTFISIVKRYRLAAFLILTFGISWGSGILGIGLFPFGPSLAGVLLVLLTYDPDERRDFWRRVIDVRRISVGGYLLVILIIPALIAASVFLDVLLGGSPPGMVQLGQVVRQPQMLLQLVFTTFFVGAFSEELGWRGYSLDSALRRWSALRSSLVIGIFWFAWHLPLFAVPGTLQQQWGLFTLMFWVYLLTVLLLSILFTWVSLHNRASILSAVLLHFFYNFTLGMILPFSDRMLLIQLILLALVVAFIVRFKPVATTLQQPLPLGVSISDNLAT